MAAALFGIYFDSCLLVQLLVPAHFPVQSGCHLLRVQAARPGAWLDWQQRGGQLECILAGTAPCAHFCFGPPVTHVHARLHTPPGSLSAPMRATKPVFHKAARKAACAVHTPWCDDGAAELGVGLWSDDAVCGS